MVRVFGFDGGLDLRSGERPPLTRKTSGPISARGAASKALSGMLRGVTGQKKYGKWRGGRGGWKVSPEMFNDQKVPTHTFP